MFFVNFIVLQHTFATMNRTGPMMNEPMTYTTERRSGKDRRVKRFGNLRWFLKTGQRRKIRREADRRKITQLDSYPTELLVVIIFVLGLSVTDGILTLWLIDRGATELNPVMAYYLDLGPHIFMLAKYLLTAFVVIITVVMNYVGLRLIKIQFGQMLKVYAGCFAMVVAWELFLIAQLAM